ncbi:hypothetical protein SALBM135S_03121 [Streptomyces alboniger]
MSGAGGFPYGAASCSAASVRALLRALRAGPRQPQVQWADTKRPFSTVVVRWDALSS